MSGITEQDSVAREGRQEAQASGPPSLGKLLWVWLGLGAQSFGGGTATLYLIRRAVVERHGWLTDEEFTRDWAICQVAPGINLLGLTTLIGWKVAGAPGVALALLGLLLPSVAITVLLTAGYAGIRQLAVVQEALRGIVPATAGLGLLMAVKLARPVLAESRREGWAILVLSWALLLGSTLAALWRAPVVGVLWGAGLLSALAHWRRGAAGEPAP
jgi:chromate transporter